MIKKKWSYQLQFRRNILEDLYNDSYNDDDEDHDDDVKRAYWLNSLLFCYLGI